MSQTNPATQGVADFPASQAQHRKGMTAAAPLDFKAEGKPFYDRLQDPETSIAKHAYPETCEQGVNEMINGDISLAHAFLSMHAYFSRANVSLPGHAAYFLRGYSKLQDQIKLFIAYQTKKGGTCCIEAAAKPDAEFNDPEKGDCLFAQELAVSANKLRYQKLLQLHKLAEEHCDPELQDFVQDRLREQVAATRIASEFVSKLRRVGRGEGEYLVDRELAECALLSSI